MIARTASGSPEDGEEAGLSESGSRVLVMTVGTGEMTRLEESLFAPLWKSISTDAWTQVVLLPSQGDRGVRGDRAGRHPGH